MCIYTYIYNNNHNHNMMGGEPCGWYVLVHKTILIFLQRPSLFIQVFTNKHESVQVTLHFLLSIGSPGEYPWIH